MTQQPQLDTRRRIRRRGSTYILTMSVALIVSVIGMGAMAVMRLQGRQAVMEQDWHEAGVVSFSATEHALANLGRDYWWREVYQNYKNGSFTPESTFSRGKISFQLEDVVDNNLTDDPADPVRIYGRGRVGNSVRVYSVLAWPNGATLDVLRTAIHTDGQLTLSGPLDLRNGPGSSNAALSVNNGLLMGNAEALSIDNASKVTGTVLVPAPAKTMPAKVIFDVYKSLGSEIKHGDLVTLSGGNLQNTLVSPARHPTQPSKKNADGLYWIKVPASTILKIKDCRIEGTLLVELSASAKLKIDPNVVWKSYRPDFPALIVYTKDDAGTTVDIICSGQLSEASLNINFNPPDTPYYGTVDSDKSDTYSAAIRGLIHVIRDTGATLPTSLTTITATNKITGCIVADGKVKTMDGSIIANDPLLYAKPPLGYTTSRSPTNLLTNGDFEGGTTAWITVGTGTTFSWGGGQHAGAKCIEVKTRSSAASGIRQDVTSQITSGKTYNSDVWLKMRDNPEDVKVSLEISSTGEGVQWLTVTIPQVQKSWTRAQASFTPTWTGTLTYARWVVTSTTTPQNFYIDDALLVDAQVQSQLPANLLAIPGTWRWEPLP